MRIAIYDAWLHTLGGGEKHMLTAAISLSIDHEVHIHSHIPIASSIIEQALGLDIHNLKLCFWPNKPDSELLTHFKDYDLFINATHNSMLENPCKRGLLLLFFPPPPPNHTVTTMARCLQNASRYFGIPQFGNGFYGPENIGRGWFRNTGRTAEIELPKSAGAGLRFMAGNPSDRTKKVAVLLNGQGLSELQIPPTNGNFLQVGPIVARSTNQTPLTYSIHVPDVALGPTNNQDESREIGIAITDPNTGSKIQIPYRLLTQRFLPRLGEEIERLTSSSGYAALASYNRILANSDFTATWLKKWWGLPSEVLYPPVTPIGTGSYSATKEPEILSVGRYFIGGHNKNHQLMINTFKTMLESGLVGWKLRLIGATGSAKKDRAYVSRLRSLAQGLPIQIETDVQIATLRKAYQRASLYWHAAGYGQSERLNPSRFEHFGIAPVEAMSSGAIPIAFDGGGVRETIEHEKSGYIWKSCSELEKISWTLIRDGALRKYAADAGVQRSIQYRPERFQRAFLRIVRELD